jgi:hypothetical protein
MRFLDIDEEEARRRITLDYRLSPRFTIGLEYDGVSEVLPRATWFAVPMTASAPSVTLGFTADRLSTPEGYAVFLTFSKSLDPRFTPFVSVKYSTEDEMVAFPFGANYRLAPDMTMQAIYDGNYTHLLLSKAVGDGTLSLVFARTKHLGIAYSFGF